MITICIDIGNSRTKIGIFVEDLMIPDQSFSYKTDLNATSNELVLTIKELIKSYIDDNKN